MGHSMIQFNNSCGSGASSSSCKPSTGASEQAQLLKEVYKGERLKDMMPLWRSGAESAALAGKYKFWEQQYKLAQNNEKDPSVAGLKPLIQKEMFQTMGKMQDQAAASALMLKGLLKHAEDVKKNPGTPPIELPDIGQLTDKPGTQWEPVDTMPDDDQLKKP